MLFVVLVAIVDANQSNRVHVVAKGFFIPLPVFVLDM